MSATSNMISYAKTIAIELNIDEPDYSQYTNTSEFISKNSSEFKRKQKLKRIEYKNKEILEKTNISENFILYVQDNLLNKHGIYLFWSNDKVVYVGKGIDLSDRVITSLQDRLTCCDIDGVSFIICNTEADMHILEIVLITELKPVLNRDCNCVDYSNHFKSGIDIDKLYRKEIK